MTISTPQPTVLHLLTIFRQISAGEIRIPAFQRDFVWKQKQILDLLDSVRSGFPIGSILLWRVERAILKIAASAQTSFPEVTEKYPTSYVLDGMQRLSSLYGVFHFGTSTDPRFNVWFDLQNERFLHEEDLEPEQKITMVPMAALFAPRVLIEHQSRISKLDNSDVLIDRMVALQAAFQDYMVPVVIIGGEDVGPIVRVFESINSTGTLLSKVDFMRAITWAQDFDLSKSLDRASNWLDEIGFNLSEETIVKCVGMILGIDPSTQSLLNLRAKTSNELEDGFGKFQSSFAAVHKFLQEHLFVGSSDFVPYEGQILVLFKAIGLGEAATQREIVGLKRWFWATSFNESLRGKPDHYVVRAINNWRGLIDGAIRGLEPRLKLAIVDFLERRLIKGKALSSAFTAMFAANEARDLTSTMLIETSGYMRESDPRVFSSIFELAELDEIGMGDGNSTRIFANLVLDPSGKLQTSTMFSAREAIANLVRLNSMDVLESQFIDEATARALIDGDWADFLVGRSERMEQAAQRLVDSGVMR